MSQGSNVMGQGDKTLSKAAGMVSTAQADFNRLSANLSDQIRGYENQWKGQGGAAFFTLHQAWTEKQNTIVKALSDFEASLTSTERDNTSTDSTQSSNYANITGRLS